VLSGISDQADKIGSRHGSQSDASDSSAELTGSWLGCYLRSSVPSVAAVYMTLRRQSARFRSCSPATLHVPWARTSSCTEPRFQDPARSCLLQVFYAKLSQSSTQVWPVILTSVRLPVGTGQDAELQKTRGRALLALYLLQEKKNSLVNSTYAGASCPLHLDSPVYYWHVTSVFHCFFEYDIIAWPDVGS